MAENEFHYSKYPKLAAYIDRIEAEQLNFRRFMKKTFRGRYYLETALVTIMQDFTIHCTREEYEPTETEAKEIKEELSQVDFPKSIKASAAQLEDLLASGLIKGNLFSFYDSERKGIIMAQERIDTDLGKIYKPWSLWFAKGGKPQWRAMEPDGKLPFWKPPKRRGKSSIMIHEGAKTAAYIDRLLHDPEYREERKKHPWAPELEHFEHWGAIGGALAVHRVDMAELLRENVEGDVIYVADNDFYGQGAAQDFSRLYGKVMYMIRWDEKFPEGFDLADPIPDTLLSRTGNCKFSLMHFIAPATWATKKGERAPKGGRAPFVLTDDFAKEWVHTLVPELYCHKRYSQHSFDKDTAFNGYVQKFSDTPRTSDLLRKKLAGSAVGVNYDPGAKPGLFQGPDQRSFYNTYIPSHILPYSEKEAKHIDYTMWDEFLNYLFPNEYERKIVSRWAATLMACGGVKMNYGLLLISEVQGVGKSTFADVIAEVLGNHNVAVTQEQTILGRFSDWAEKQLVIINEIYQGHSTAAYNKLKEVITDKKVRVEKKHVNEYTVDNHVHVIACSNSMRALRLDNTDRRWFVPLVNYTKPPQSYWVKLYDWLEHEEGYRKVKQWAKDYVQKHGAVERGGEAPWTRTKEDMVKEGDNANQGILRGCIQWAREIVETSGEDEHIEQSVAPESFRLLAAAIAKVPIVMFDRDGVRAVEMLSKGGRDEKVDLRDVRKIAEQEGFFVGKERITKPAPGYKRQMNSRVISSSEEIAKGDPNGVTMAGADAKGMCLLDLARLVDEFRSL